MRIEEEIAQELYVYLSRKVDADAYFVNGWKQVHDQGCHSATGCICFKSTRVVVDYTSQPLGQPRRQEQWIFEGTFIALIKMLDAFREMES